MYTSVYELYFEAEVRPPEVHSWHQYYLAGSITMVFASGVGLCPGPPNFMVSDASSSRGGERTIKDWPLAQETVEPCADRALFDEDTTACALSVS